jgi:competence protein ComGC
MFGEKSQSSLLVILGIISIATIVFIYNLYKQVSQTNEMMKGLKIAKIQTYIEMFKGYSRNSLILSSHSSSINVAKKGGNTASNPVRTWICNSNPSVPSLDEIRYHLSEETKRSFNFYLQSVNNSKENEGMTILIGKSQCIDYDVRLSDIMSGLNDERFNIGSYGSYIYIDYDGNVANSSNFIYEEIPKNRIWYMYRIFKQWSEENALKSYICGCMSEICKCDQKGKCGDSCPSFDLCINESLKKTLNDLQSKFDEYVDCSFEKKCCYNEKQSCGDVDGCTPWYESPDCNNCNLGEKMPLCIQNNIEFSSVKPEYQWYHYEPKMSIPKEIIPEDECQDKIVEMWNTVKASTEAYFSCTDKKYALSVPGNNYLRFNIHVNIALQSRQCYSKGSCECEWNCVIDTSTGKCEDGSDPVCKECVPSTLRGHWCTECH